MFEKLKSFFGWGKKYPVIKLEKSKKICSLKIFDGLANLIRDDGQETLNIKRKELRLLLISNNTSNPQQMDDVVVTYPSDKLIIKNWKILDAIEIPRTLRIDDPRALQEIITTAINKTFKQDFQSNQLIYKESDTYDWDVYTRYCVKVTLQNGMVHKTFYNTKEAAQKRINELKA